MLTRMQLRTLELVEWLTERCDFHADAKSSLAVLHNRNDIAVRAGELWVVLGAGSTASEAVQLVSSALLLLTGTGQSHPFSD